LADQGSNRATQDNWVWAVNPALVLASLDVAEGDIATRVLERLAGRTLLRTDEQGTITVLTDGEQIWVETER
jgi:beta-lactamase superfamily II metal-dependent hydrolase